MSDPDELRDTPKLAALSIASAWFFALKAAMESAAGLPGAFGVPPENRAGPPSGSKTGLPGGFGVPPENCG